MVNETKNVSLSELVTLEKRPIIVEADAEYAEIGIYCFGRGIFHKTPRSGLEVGDKQLLMLKEGDFIFQITFAWEGAVAIVSKAEDGMYCSSRFPTFRVNENICYPKYLLNYFRTPDGLQQLVNISPGSAGRNRVLSLKRIPEVIIPLPSVEEQRRIVGRIEELAGKIAEARGLRERSIEECGLLLRSSVKAVIYNESTRQTLKPLKDLVTIKGGGTPSKQNPMFWKGSIPWISAKDIKKREVHNSIDHISEDALNNSSTKMIEAGAVIVVTRGMILAHTFPSTILRIPATINQDLKALIPRKEISSEYLSHVLWALNDSILELVEKSTHDTRKLETPKLLNFEIPVPQLQEQQHIVTYLDELQSKVDTMKRLRQESLKELDALLPAILDKAFKGEL